MVGNRSSQNRALGMVVVMHAARISYVKILRPDFRRAGRNGQTILPVPADYVIAPRLETYGTWKMVDLLEFETLAVVSLLRDGMRPHTVSDVLLSPIERKAKR